jgi:hypothetical protein
VSVTISDRYRVLATLTTTAEGLVYAADDLKTGGPVHVTVLRGDAAADAEFVAAVREQAQRLAKPEFRHPALVAVHDCDTAEDGGLFVVQEPVAGRSLREILDARGPFDVASGVRLAIRIGEALERLHWGGVVHGALRPETVRLVESEDGTETIKVLGAEFARAYQTAAGLRLRDRSLLPYLAPEQVELNETTEAADVHALGLLVREMLTGQKPGGAGGHDGAVRDLPAAIASIVAKSLERATARRYANVSLMVNDLWSAESEPAPSAPVRAAALAGERRSAQGRRARSDAGMVTALVVGLLLVGVTAWVVTSDRLAGTASTGAGEQPVAASPPAPAPAQPLPAAVAAGHPIVLPEKAATAQVAPGQPIALPEKAATAPARPELEAAQRVAPSAAPASARPLAATSVVRARDAQPAASVDSGDGAAIIDWLLKGRRPGS